LSTPRFELGGGDLGSNVLPVRSRGHPLAVYETALMIGGEKKETYDYLIGIINYRIEYRSVTFYQCVITV